MSIFGLPRATLIRLFDMVDDNTGTVIEILLELDSSVASSRDKGRLIEAVQKLHREGA